MPKTQVKDAIQGLIQGFVRSVAAFLDLAEGGGKVPSRQRERLVYQLSVHVRTPSA